MLRLIVIEQRTDMETPRLDVTAREDCFVVMRLDACGSIEAAVYSDPRDDTLCPALYTSLTTS